METTTGRRYHLTAVLSEKSPSGVTVPAPWRTLGPSRMPGTGEQVGDRAVHTARLRSAPPVRPSLSVVSGRRLLSQRTVGSESNRACDRVKIRGYADCARGRSPC